MSEFWTGQAAIPESAAEGPESHRAIQGAMAAIRHSAQEDGIDPGSLVFSVHGPARSQGRVVTETDPITGQTLPAHYLIRGTNDSGDWKP